MVPWESYLRKQKSQHLEDLLDFLRIASISSLPEHAVDVQRAGEWVAARLETAPASRRSKSCRQEDIRSFMVNGCTLPENRPS